MNNQKNITEEIIEKMDQSSKEFDLLLNLDTFLTSITKNFSLSDVQRDIVDGEITLFLTKQHSSDEFFDNLSQHLILDLEKEVVEGIRKEVEKFLIDIKSTTKKENEADAPSPAEALANIQERLAKPSMVAPITRDYSVNRSTETPTNKTPAPRAPSMDIYRESPDK